MAKKPTHEELERQIQELKQAELTQKRTNSDVTERKLSEEILEMNESTFQFFVPLMVEPIHRQPG